MNEQQAFATVRNAIRLENLGRDLAAKVTPELAEIFKSVRETIKNLPPGSIEREIRYKQLRMQLASLFRGPNARFYVELKAGLERETLQQLHWAENWLRIAEQNPAQAELAAEPRLGLAAQMPSGQTEPAVQFTRGQIAALANSTEVLGQRLEQLFDPDSEIGLWIKDNIKQIDKTVKRGFLLGETNEEIARQLGGLGRQAIMRNQTIARTAVMDMSQRAHEAYWDEHASDLIARWQFDATLDYRVCLQCAPWDGVEAKDRRKLPQVPTHPNCRCSVLPVLQFELDQRKTGEGLDQTANRRRYVEISNRKPVGGKPYKGKARVDGKNYYKVARDAKGKDGQPLTMPGFLQKTTPQTREAVLGKTRAREWEYLVNDNRGPKRTDLDDVLRDLIKADADSLQRAQRSRSRRRK